MVPGNLNGDVIYYATGMLEPDPLLQPSFSLWPPSRNPCNSNPIYSGPRAGIHATPILFIPAPEPESMQLQSYSFRSPSRNPCDTNPIHSGPRAGIHATPILFIPAPEPESMQCQRRCLSLLSLSPVSSTG